MTQALSTKESSIYYHHRQYALYPLQDQFTNLCYLRVDSPMTTELRLDSLLQRCPNLQYFFGISTDFFNSFGDMFNDVTSNLNQRDNFSGSSVSLDAISRWCPKLKYFMGHDSYKRSDVDQFLLQRRWKQEQQYDSNISATSLIFSNATDEERQVHQQQEQFNGDNSLSCLSLCEDFYDNDPEVVSTLTKHQHRLAYLKLKLRAHYGSVSVRGIDWGPMFQLLRMNQLRTFICQYIDFNITSVFIMLNNCPVIETLELHYSVGFDQMDIDQISLESMHTYPTLRSLTLSWFDIDDELSLTTFFGRLPGLEELTITSMYMPSFEKIFHTHFYQCFQQLKYLYMDNVILKQDTKEPGEEERLTAITNNNSETFASFFTNLSLAQDYAQNIQTIHLWNITYVTWEVLDAIACLHSLKRLLVLLDKPVIKNINDNSNSNDDQLEQQQQRLLKFIRKLRGTNIEELSINDVYYLSTPVFDALGDLRSLKTLSLDISRNHVVPKECYELNKINYSGVLTMISKSSSLCQIKLAQVQGQNDITVSTDTFLATHERITSFWIAKWIFGTDGFVIGETIGREEASQKLIPVENLILERI